METRGSFSIKKMIDFNLDLNFFQKASTEGCSISEFSNPKPTTKGY
jgi:hypothetical protein